MTTVSRVRTVWITDVGLFCTFIALSAAADALVHPPSVPDTVEAWPYAQSRFCCPARHHFRATPTSPPLVPPALPVSPNLADDYRHRIVAEAWGSQVRFSVHFPCMLLTLPRVLRRCECLFLPGGHWPSPLSYRVGEYPACAGLSLNRALPATNARRDLTRLHHSFSYYGLQVWPAPLTGFAAPCRGKFHPGVAAQVRPQPTYLQRQLVWRAPFIPLVNGFVTSYVE